MADQSMGMREYRKGNWTVQETMILMEAKKMDDERRKLSRKHSLSPTTSGAGASPSSIKPVMELRWKWVEEYCWRKGCFRSQNQCNDKWDNLMRDYKKVRDYQRSLLDDQQESKRSDKSYWEMDKVERKDKGLPTNMLPQIYQALVDVVERSSSSTATTPSTMATTAATTTTTTTTSPAQYLLAPPAFEMQQPGLAALYSPMSLPPPPPPMPSLRLPLLQTPAPPPPLQLPFYSHQQQQQPHPSPTLESETSEHSHPESPAKRRRKDERAGEGPSGTAATTQVAAAASTSAVTSSSLQEVSSAICRSATILSEAIQASEEGEEKRHREMMNIHERRLRIEESKLEITRQGLHGLADAINKLASSILTWANSHKPQGP